MRFIAAYLPWLRVELARSRMPVEERKAPLAIVISKPGGAVKDERSLLGNTRLDEISPEARALGVRVGQTIASARAKTTDLRVRVVPMDAVTEALARAAEAGLAFGATTSFDVTTDVICIDITGCAHLHGEGEEGEAALADKLGDCIRALGHSRRVAIADGPRVAMAAARYFPQRGDAPVIVPAGGNAEAMRVMPLVALPLDEETRGWLTKIGIKRGGDLQRLPRASLGTRLGAASAAVMALLQGDDGAPLKAYVPPEVPEERAELEYGIAGTEPLLFVAKTLCDRLSARLAGRAMAAARLEMELKLDHAVARDVDLPPKATLEMTLSAPLSEVSALLAVLRARVDAYVIPAPILAVTLRAPELVRKEGGSLDLFLAESKAQRALPRLVAELAADLGDERVGLLELASSWMPEERTRIVPYGKSSAHAERGELLSRAMEPARIVVPTACGTVRGVQHLGRIEAASWWRYGVTSRDFFSAWADEERAVAFLERDAAGETVLRGWMD